MINYLSKINYLSIKLITDQKMIDYIWQNPSITATNVCAKFNFDRFHIDIALGNFQKSNNNKHKNNVYGAWRPVSGQKFFWIVTVAYWTRCISEYNSNSTKSEIGQTCRYFVKKIP